MPEVFSPFLAAPGAAAPADVTLHVFPPDPAVASLAARLLDTASPTLRLPSDEGLTLLRSEGRFVATTGFERCEVYPTPVGAAAPFTGRPWLALALWGYLAHHGGALLHAAACALEGSHVLLLGDSGAGKSTLSELIVAAGGTCLTEECCVVKAEEGVVTVHATPWYGVGGAAVALEAPVEAVFILRHAPANEVRRIEPAEAGRHLLRSAQLFAFEAATIPDTIELLDRAATTLPAYDLGFLPEPSAVTAIREVL